MALPDVPEAPTLSEATSGDETEFYVALDGATWVKIGELDPENGLNDLPSGEQSTYETTHMNSGKFKEFKKNKRVEGTETEISGNLVLGSEDLDTLRAIEQANGSIPYLIVLKQNADIYDATGNALFYSLKLSNPGTEVRQFTITAKWVTEMTLTKRAAA